MDYAINAFKNPNKDVRDASFTLIMNCYKYIGDNVRNYFKDLRPAQITTLEEGFEQIDGLNSPAKNNKKNNNSPKKPQRGNQDQDSDNNRSMSRSRELSPGSL